MSDNDLQEHLNRRKLLRNLGIAAVSAGSAAMVLNKPVAAQSSTCAFLNVKDYGAVGNGTTDDSASIQMAIDSLPGSGGTVLFPPGVYRVADTIRVLRNNVSLIGAGPDATVLLADVALPAVVRFGDAATVNVVINCSIERMTIDRQAGTIPIGSVGILWELFNYGDERLTYVNRHYYGRKITGIGPPTSLSIEYSLYEPYSSNATRAHMCIEHAAGIKVFGGMFGRNGGEQFNSVCMIEIAGTANDVTFVGSTFVPIGPAINSADKPAVIFITGKPDAVAVYRFIDCNTENTSAGFASDAATPQLNDIHVVGGRWAMEMSMFNFHPNTKIVAMKLTNASISKPVILVNSKWLTISGCSIAGNSAFHGGAEADMTITGNRFLGSVFLGGAFRGLMFTGNVHNGLTDTASGNKLVANNLQSEV